MSGDPRWEQLEELFERVSGVRPEDRTAWLATHCGHDPALRAEPEWLVAGSADMVITGGCDTVQNPLSYLCFAKAGALSRSLGTQV